MQNASRVYHPPVFEQQQPLSKTGWNYNRFAAWCQLIAGRCTDWLVCCIICSQRIMLGDSKANAKYIRCTRENRLTYRLFVPHDENVLSLGCRVGKKQLEIGRGATHSANRAPQILGAALIPRSPELVSWCRICWQPSLFAVSKSLHNFPCG